VNWIDFLILALLLGGFLWSFRHGFIMEVIYFVAAFVGLLGAFFFYPMLETVTRVVVDSQVGASTVSFGAIFLVLAGLVTLLGTLFHKFLYMIHLGIFDRLLGGLFGMAKVAMVISVCLVMFIGVKGEETPEYIEQSTIAQPVVTTTTTVLNGLPDVLTNFHEDYGEDAMEWLRQKRNQVGVE
jgi:membrane protein required for colicin V production